MYGIFYFHFLQEKVNKQSLGTVEPCVMCAGAIAWAQTGKLVFGAEDEKRGYQKYAGSALHPKTVVVKGVMADECATLMKEFFAAKRK